MKVTEIWIKQNIFSNGGRNNLSSTK